MLTFSNTIIIIPAPGPNLSTFGTKPLYNAANLKRVVYFQDMRPGLGSRWIFTDSRLLVPPKLYKLLLPTPSIKFYFITIREHIISFYAIYYYFHSLIASNKYRNMFIRLILLTLVTNCENFQFFNFIY